MRAADARGPRFARTARYRGDRMSASQRVKLVVAGVALAAAGIVAGVVWATAQHPAQPTVQCTSRPRPLVVPGIRSSYVAAVRDALARPPAAAARALESLARVAPNDPVVQFNYGTALLCAGYLADAEQAYLAAKKAGYDTYYEMRADEILHPQFFQPPDGLYPLPQLNRRDPLIERGRLLQRQGHQHSAEKLYAKAARLHPKDDEAQVAAAVGRFDESNLSAAFSRLGPLVLRFPRSQAVRFNLGLLLAWTGQRTQAVKEFRRAVELGRGTTLGREAAAFVSRLS
jgi:predicted Zn-dependent protease